ncbi:hypothetical protein D9613_009220 [Agrocybe pediades]|uniref:Uncharacterized protein n=1 Tax=Agrocybe pediades TaxID=84607 RepID=A0A8H4R2Y6_9AGAR|nr:hypothetical protein D9613_009220 [Agrocybe pediades]
MGYGEPAKATFCKRLLFRLRSNGVVKRIWRADSSALQQIPSPPGNIIELALEALETMKRHSSNLRELLIMLPDTALSTASYTLLDSLFEGCFAAPNCRSLVVDVPVTHLQTVFLRYSPYTSKKRRACFKEVDLQIAGDESIWTEESDWHKGSIGLIYFFKACSETLTSLTISCAVQRDLGTFFKKMPHCPNLSDFILLAIFNIQTFSEPHWITGFIAKHASTLKTLIIRPRPRIETIYRSDSSYRQWLTQDDTLDRPEVYHLVSQLCLPKLQFLDIGLQEAPYSASPRVPLMPNLSTLAPNLTDLAITEVKLNVYRLSRILDTMAIQDGENILERLYYSCNELSRQTFDMLSRKLPRLKSLRIAYTDYEVPDSLGIPIIDELRRAAYFHETMARCSYKSWTVRYLQLLRPSACGRGHPCEEDMLVVGACISPEVALDSRRGCFCW